MRIMTCLFIALLLCSTPLDARPGNDPNAAVRYLNAIGHLPATSESFFSELGQAETYEQLEKLGTEAINFLKLPKVKSSMDLLRLGAACPQCNFTPDDRQHFTDFIPPYRRIRELARIGRAYAWMRDTAGNPDEAFDTLTSIFTLGQHVEDNGVIISTMIGIAVRKIALNSLAEFRMRHPEEAWKTRLAAFFKRFPRPVANLAASVRYEAESMNNTLIDAKQRPEIFRDIGMELDIATMPAAEAKPDHVKVCQANQRVLLGALEMLSMDYSQPLPATISADPLSSLVKLQYLKQAVSCPEGGNYQLIDMDKESRRVACSLHGDVYTLSEPDVRAGDEKKAATAAYLAKLSATPEYDRLIGECMKMYDEVIALDPNAADFEKKADDIQKRVETSPNIFIRNGIPNLKKAFGHARELEEKIDALLK